MPVASRASLAYIEKLAHDDLVLRNRGVPPALTSLRHDCRTYVIAPELRLVDIGFRIED